MTDDVAVPYQQRRNPSNDGWRCKGGYLYAFIPLKVAWIAMACPWPRPWSFLSQPTISIALTPGFSKPFFSASFLNSMGVFPVFGLMTWFPLMPLERS